jgi:hypothetical protein
MGEDWTFDHIACQQELQRLNIQWLPELTEHEKSVTYGGFYGHVNHFASGATDDDNGCVRAQARKFSNFNNAVSVSPQIQVEDDEIRCLKPLGRHFPAVIDTLQFEKCAQRMFVEQGVNCVILNDEDFFLGHGLPLLFVRLFVRLFFRAS